MSALRSRRVFFPTLPQGLPLDCVPTWSHLHLQTLRCCLSDILEASYAVKLPDCPPPSTPVSNSGGPISPTSQSEPWVHCGPGHPTSNPSAMAVSQFCSRVSDATATDPSHLQTLDSCSLLPQSLFPGSQKEQPQCLSNSVTQLKNLFRVLVPRNAFRAQPRAPPSTSLPLYIPTCVSAELQAFVQTVPTAWYIPVLSAPLKPGVTTKASSSRSLSLCQNHSSDSIQPSFLDPVFVSSSV